MSGQENGARASEQVTGSGDGNSKAEPPPFRNYFITGRDVCVVKIKQLIEVMRPTAPEELGSTSFIERMGDTAMVCGAASKDPGRYLDHLIKHEKHKVLVHELVMITHWFEEILPHLFENSANNRIQPNTPDGSFIFIGSAPVAFAIYRVLCCKAVNSVLGHLNAAQSFGTAILDVIDVSLLALREFMAKDHEPWLACSVFNPRMYDEYDRHAMLKNWSKMSRVLSAKLALCCVKNLMKLVSHLDALPDYVLTKLIHPDTRFIPTLLDLIEQKPWDSIIKQHLKATAKKLYKDKDPNFQDVAFKLHKMESQVMELLSNYSKIISKTLPRGVAVAHLMPREYSGQLLELMDKCGDESLDEARKEVAILTSIECPEPELNWTAPEPSPYHMNVRTELAEKKEAIIAIHGAMDSFETQVENCENRCDRDLGFIYKIKDLNFCSKCKKPEARLRCSRCQVKYYCNRKCQSKHWATHKLTCEEPKVRRERETRQIRKATTSASALSEFVRGYFSILF